MSFTLVDFLQALAAGILVGSAYALMCIGLGIIFGAMRVINFAQGDFLMLGMYAAFYLTTGYGMLAFLGPYAGPIVAAFLAGPIVFAIGWLLHRFIVVAGHRRRRRGDRRRRGLRPDHRHARAVADPAEWRADRVRLDPGRDPHAAVALARGRSATILLNQARCVSFLVAAALAAAVYLFLGHTRRGKGLRAAADNSAGGDLHGHRCRPRAPHRLEPRRRHHRGRRRALASSQSFQPYTGFDFVIVMYAGVVLGGLGSILGAFWGGLLIGIVQQMSTLVLPYQLQNTAIFVVFLLIIFLRPQGMFGRLSERT